MLLDLLLRYGYGMVFVAAAVEGDATLLTATFLAHRGYLQLDWVIAVAATATVAVNQVYFWLARTYGQDRSATLREHPAYGRVFGWVTRYGWQLVIASRFIYGFRIAIPMVCGAIGLQPVRFLVGDIIGSALWATTVGLAGYAIGQALEYVIDDVRRHEWWIAIGLLVVGLAILAWRGRDRPLVLLRGTTLMDAGPKGRGKT